MKLKSHYLANESTIFGYFLNQPHRSFSNKYFSITNTITNLMKETTEKGEDAWNSRVAPRMLLLIMLKSE